MCGIVGVRQMHENSTGNAALIAGQALEALTNRGQDATGIAVLNPEGRDFTFVGGEGTPDKVYNLEQIAGLTGRVALGQNRYTTDGDPGWIQPTEGKNLTIVHNGNLSHPFLLQDTLRRAGVDFTDKNDSQQIGLFMDWRMEKGASLVEAATDAYRLIRKAGSFCIIASDTEGSMVAFRDPHGIRPLVVAEEEGVVASETNALDAVGIRCEIENEGKVWRGVRAGELLYFGKDGTRSIQLEEGEEAIDATEIVYTLNGNSILPDYGRRVNQIRQSLGRQLAKEHPPTKYGVVVGVPNSGLEYAKGFAAESGLPLVNDALYIAKEAKSKRSFMESTPQARMRAIRAKLRAYAEKIIGRVIYAVEDSVFRGNAQIATNDLLTESGAAEIHTRVGSGRIEHPNRLGIDTRSGDELVARGRTDEQLAQRLGSHSIGFVSVNGMWEAIDPPPGHSLTMPDFTGENPIVRHHEEQRQLARV